MASTNNYPCNWIREQFYFILKDSEVIPCGDVDAWTKFMRSTDRRIAVDDVWDCTISTVFLGQNHQFRLGQPPILFETMTFSSTFEEVLVRYSTLDEAKAGHVKIVEAVAKWYESECKKCRFYHGKDDINCAIHPHGNKSDRCLDWESKP